MRYILLIFIYRVALDLMYNFSIVPNYEYLYGFTYDYSFPKVLGTYFIAFLMAPVLRRYNKRNDCSSYFIGFLLFLYFIPFTSLFAYDQIDNTYFIYNTLSFLILISVDTFVPKVKLRREHQNIHSNIFFLFLISLFLINTLVLGYFSGFRVTLNIVDVYELRNEGMSKTSTLLGYFQPYAARIIPIIIVYLLLKKRWFWVALLCLTQVISFSFNGMKYTIFALFIALIIYFFVHNLSLLSFMKKIVMLSIVSVLLIFIFNNEFLAEIIFRRICYIPNKLSYYYYDFFKNHELLYFRESFMRLFGFQNPYDVRIPALIGNTYMGRNMGANTGLFGEAYSQIAWGAIIVYPILYVVAFRFYDALVLKNSIPQKVMITGVILYTISFIDGSYFSILLTQGFILSCITMYLLSKIKFK